MKNYLLLLALFCCFSCTREEEGIDCPTREPLSTVEDCLKPFLFETGSYWVYQDSQTLEEDSTYVTGHDLKVEFDFNQRDPCPGQVKYIGITFESTRRETYRSYLHNSTMTDWKEFPFSSNARVLLECSGSPVSSLEVNNVLYNTVFQSDTIDSINYYMVGGLGIIRIEDFSDTTDTAVYDLIRHEVQLFEAPD